MPLHELVQAAHVAYQLVAGTQIEMIGVAQHERGVDVLEVFRRESLDRRLRTHGCKDWREQVTVWGGKDPVAGAVVASGDRELEHRENYSGAVRN